MRLGIDASNIRSGGGVTHLVELLRAADPFAYGFAQVVVWASRATLSRLDDRSWLLKRHDPVLERDYVHRALWQRNRLGVLAKAERCDLLFVPGGSFATDFRPVVTMSQNMLPFEWKEMLRFGLSTITLRYAFLRWSQTRSYRNADGIIFLTRYARSSVLSVTGTLQGKTATIPHGINRRFFMKPRRQISIHDYDEGNPFKIIYVSIVNVYKHQWNVVDAVAALRVEGLPVTLEMIGPSYRPALRHLQKTIMHVDPENKFINYLGNVPYDELHAKYAEADMCVFASSCENMPIILLEGMAAGLPIASSNYGPMPEMLGDNGVYFDPESAASIEKSIKELIYSPDLRMQVSEGAYEQSQMYSWKRCANETFGFLREVLSNS